MTRRPTSLIISLFIAFAMFFTLSMATGKAQTIARGMLNYASSASSAVNRVFGRVQLANTTITPSGHISTKLMGDNNAPVIMAGGTFNRTQGAGASNATVAIVGDVETEPGYLLVAASNVPAGITVKSIKNTNGTITADLAATCLSALGNNTITLTVTDENNATQSATMTVYVTPASFGTVGIYPNISVIAGGNSTSIPNVAPADATGVSALASVGFHGTLAVNATTGAVMVTNAGPASADPYTITVQVTSGCTTAGTSFNLTVNNSNSCASASFATRNDFSVGSQPSAAAIGDFNSDGIQDLAVANYAGNSASVRLGDGAGGFFGNTEVIVGTNPQGIVVGDFNGDGNEDFAVANYNTNYVSIRLGDGEGSFTSVSNMIVGVQPFSLATGDFNSDGKQDLAVANTDPGSVSIHLGDGAGYFTTATDVSVGSYPTWVAIGDFNNDAIQDFATANLDNGTVSIRLGDGNAGFSGTTELSIGNPISVAIGDFNNDGFQDIAAANYSGGKVSIRLGDGTGDFSGGTDIIVGDFPASVVLGDFNGDGKLDFTTANRNSNTASIQLGDGDGNFTAASDLMTGYEPRIALVGDFNEDGMQDIAVANAIDNTVSIMLSDCAGGTLPTITTQPNHSTVFAGNTASFTVAGDGSPTPTVRWQFSTDDGTTFNDLKGEMNTTLSFTADVSQNGYLFQAVLTNSVGSATSSVASLTVNRRNSITRVTSSQNPSVFGEGVTFKASVKEDASRVESVLTFGPTGTVSFLDGGNPIADCTSVALAFGQAQCVNASLVVGNHTITAQYSGDDRYDTSNGSLTGNPQVITSGLTLVPTEGLSRMQGTPSSNSQIAVVNDNGASSGNVSVVAMSLPSGITVTNITNTNGVITADLEAICTAEIGDNTVVLKATGSNKVETTANLIVNVAANTLPTLGNYANQTVVLDCTLVINPDAAPADNISVVSVTAIGSKGFTGVISVAPASGVVTITNNGAVGLHTITVTATDSCDASSNKTMTVEVLPPPTVPIDHDFDGDRKADISVYRAGATSSDPSLWYILRSSDNVFGVTQLGVGGDLIVPGDYDGDGDTDFAVYRPSTSTWLILTDPSMKYTEVQWGMAGDIVVPGYYDADNKMDIAVLRPSTGVWYIANSTGGTDARRWGQKGDKLVPADYDGDGQTDLAVFRPSDSNWYIELSSGGSTVQNWGTESDIPVPADYDGDGKDDIAVWRPSTGIWYILESKAGSFGQEWGQLGDVPIPADYDNDGKADLAVYRPWQSVWYIFRSCHCSYTADQFGISTDTPIPSAFVPTAGF